MLEKAWLWHDLWPRPVIKPLQVPQTHHLTKILKASWTSPRFAIDSRKTTEVVSSQSYASH